MKPPTLKQFIAGYPLYIKRGEVRMRIAVDRSGKLEWHEERRTGSGWYVRCEVQSQHLTPEEAYQEYVEYFK